MRKDRGSTPGHPTITRYGLPYRTFGCHEWRIHQLLARDPEFRSLCEEHQETLRAFEHFRALDPSDPRAGEYAALASELEEELLRELQRS